MNKKLAILLSSATLLLLPLAVFATPSGDLSLGGVVASFFAVIDTFIWPLFVGFAIIMFIIAGVHFLNNKPAEGRAALLWGIVGVVVAILAFSLPGIIARLLGTTT